MSTWLQARAVRKTATKGPNPVWISARKNVNQSRRRRLARDAAGCASTALEASVRLEGAFSPRSSQSTGSVVVIVEVDSVIAPVPSGEGQRRPYHRMCQPPRSLLLPEHPAITNPGPLWVRVASGNVPATHNGDDFEKMAANRRRGSAPASVLFQT